jgi:hypothetical protein
MIRLFYFATVYYRKNKKSRNTILSLTILFLLITNLFNQITKSKKYYITFDLSNKTYQFSTNDNHVVFLKKFAIRSAAINLDEEKIKYDLYNHSLVIDEEFFFKITENAGFNPKILNFNNTETESYKEFEKKISKRFNLFIKNEAIKVISLEEKVAKRVRNIYIKEKVVDTTEPSLLFYNNLFNLEWVANSDDIISIKIEKKFITILSLNQILLLNLFILCLPLFFPNLLTTFRKLRSFI